MTTGFFKLSLFPFHLAVPKTTRLLLPPLEHQFFLIADFSFKKVVPQKRVSRRKNEIERFRYFLAATISSLIHHRLNVVSSRTLRSSEANQLCSGSGGSSGKQKADLVHVKELLYNERAIKG